MDENSIKKPAAGHPHDILIIRFRRVGDSVLAMTLCHSLKLSFPSAKIHFVINDNIAPLYKDHPDIDEIISYSREQQKGFGYIKAVWKTVRAADYDVIIDMRTTPKTLLFSLLSLHTKFRIGRRKPYNIFIHNYRIGNVAGEDRIQADLNYMKPLEKLGKLEYDHSFPLYISEKEKRKYRDYLESRGIDFSRPIVLCAVATRIQGKAWPESRMAEVIRRFIKAFPEAQIVFNYAGKAEEESAERIYDALSRDGHIFMNVKAASLKELCALCNYSSFFFGNEGGPRHISQSFGVPSYAIYPPRTDMERWLPGRSDKFRGISPNDLIPAEKLKKLDQSARFEALTADVVWEGLKESFSKYGMKKKDGKAKSE